MDYLLLCAVTYLGVAIRAFQQINVVRGHYLLVPPTSGLFAWTDMVIVGSIATVMLNEGNQLYTWLALWAGGACGSMTSMYIHSHIGGNR